MPEGSGEQKLPVILSVPEGTHAMGVYAPPQPAVGTTGPTYGRHRFDGAKVVKWNCVFRTSNDNGLPAGKYPFRMFVVVGDLASVSKSLLALQSEFQGPSVH